MNSKKNNRSDGEPEVVENARTADELTRQNIETVRKLEESARDQRTATDRLAQVIAGFCGSMTFVWVHVLWFGGWIVFNIMPGIEHVDPFPFTFLTLVVSLEAIFLSTFILISQNHDAQISEKRNHLDLQINLLAEQENTKMLTILKQIAAKVGVEVADDAHARGLEEQVRPEKLVEQIDQMEDK